MSFRLVPKSVTLNDLERRNGRYFALFQRIHVASACALRKSSRSLSHPLMSSCQCTDVNRTSHINSYTVYPRCEVIPAPSHADFSDASDRADSAVPVDECGWVGAPAYICTPTAFPMSSFYSVEALGGRSCY